MSRVTLALVALVGILAGALGYAVVNRPAPQTDTMVVQALIDEAISSYDAKRIAEASLAPQDVAGIDPETLNPMIESFLMGDPKILQRMSVALDTTLQAEEREQATTAIASMRDAIFNDPGQVVVGNPEGDVTLVEFFDYNCGYCRAALPDMAALLAEDPNLRIVLKEFPILSNESIDAARVAVLVGNADVDYWTFHETPVHQPQPGGQKGGAGRRSRSGAVARGVGARYGHRGRGHDHPDLLRDRAGAQHHGHADLYHRQRNHPRRHRAGRVAQPYRQYARLWRDAVRGVSSEPSPLPLRERMVFRVQRKTG
ncbi:hypothetical protein FPZ08_05060 [Devosia ginsengisoli]|uniref:Thioredoxin domain-containing protein n=1 Tax=Devosia ginsengisoli TaxID=400770 RepID=A0A5B8LPH1_9HYPH|nr:thioredoxin domain-containing protein [Devosia ginsengisoli]QDZ10168.1 hypothetical protein FPZ08_05060 [Devosia ginsengisoli]